MSNFLWKFYFTEIPHTLIDPDRIEDFLEERMRFNEYLSMKYTNNNDRSRNTLINPEVASSYHKESGVKYSGRYSGSVTYVFRINSGLSCDESSIISDYFNCPVFDLLKVTRVEVGQGRFQIPIGEEKTMMRGKTPNLEGFYMDPEILDCPNINEIIKEEHMRICMQWISEKEIVRW